MKKGVGEKVITLKSFFYKGEREFEFTRDLVILSLMGNILSFFGLNCQAVF